LPPESSFTPLAPFVPGFVVAAGFDDAFAFDALARTFSAAAALTSALNALPSSASPSRMSIALRVPPSRPALKSPVGSSNEAPFANVSLILSL
jgi:hypothetical protein